MKNLIFISSGTLILVIRLVISCQPTARDTHVTTELSRKEQLGKLLFFEKSLSTPVGQDCSDCHKPEFGFADPQTGLPVSKGAVKGRYGNRNDMPAAYAAYIPSLHKDTTEDIWVGGLFWDGRANTLEEQAMGPPLNPLEMANLDTLSIREKLSALDYAGMFEEIYGPGALSDPSIAFSRMADAIATYERSAEFNRFDSKYDHFLRGEAELSEQEIRGMGLFVSEKKGNCAACHPSTPSPDGTPPMFTDYTYDNLGAPRNPENPFYTLSPDLNPDGFNFIDLGLALTVNDPAENGKFRVPTLRNVALTPPYMHNGVFKTLYQVVAFYNTRDVGPWPPPEVNENVNDEELGDLGLSNQEVEDIVAFLMTLSDGWEAGQTVEQ
jgi:cytochrome c peroxidase